MVTKNTQTYFFESVSKKTQDAELMVHLTETAKCLHSLEHDRQCIYEYGSKITESEKEIDRLQPEQEKLQLKAERDYLRAGNNLELLMSKAEKEKWEKISDEIIGMEKSLLRACVAREKLIAKHGDLDSLEKRITSQKELLEVFVREYLTSQPTELSQEQQERLEEFNSGFKGVTCRASF